MMMTMISLYLCTFTVFVINPLYCAVLEGYSESHRSLNPVSCPDLQCPDDGAIWRQLGVTSEPKFTKRENNHGRRSLVTRSKAHYYLFRSWGTIRQIPLIPQLYPRTSAINAKWRRASSIRGKRPSQTSEPVVAVWQFFQFTPALATHPLPKQSLNICWIQLGSGHFL